MKLRRPTKRTLLVLMLFIVGGAIINVAVAWGCAILIDPDSYAGPVDERLVVNFEGDTESRLWQVSALRKPGVQILIIRFIADHEEWGGTVTDPKEITPGWAGKNQVVRNPFTDGIRIADERGLPTLALRGESIVGAKRRAEHTADAILVSSDGWPLGYWSGFSIPKLLPLRPLWPGFAINTIFYAAILWLLSAAPGFVRRRIRIIRHRCPACGYLIGTSPVCTECGTPLRIQNS